MALLAVEGAAGTGKTFRLMQAVGETLQRQPLADGQKLLALTFMHGARRRLNEKLRKVAEVRGRFECMTVDGLAWRLLRRWRSLAGALGYEAVQEGQFDAQCDAAGALLESPEVHRWAGASFPVVVVDEAQDLKPQRLRMLRPLTRSTSMLVAADEFQCLDPELRPNPALAWLREACQPQVLIGVRRTNVPALLLAAAAIRRGDPPVAGQAFRILPAQGIPMAAASLANAIAWRRGGKVAIIAPSLQGGFAQSVVRRVCEQACGARQNGPFPIRWERSEHEETAALVESLNINAVASTAETLAALERVARSGLAREVANWVRYQVRALGHREFTREELSRTVARLASTRRQRYGTDNYDLLAMTVQQAKNREFEGVVVLWPYQVGGDAEHKRRLLYNAITRAHRWCTIVVQNPELLQAPPFR